MKPSERQPVRLPSADQLRRAVELYLASAYPQGIPAAAKRFLPPQGAELERWLMGDVAERDPRDAPPANVRSFALRIGNARYPNMKLRLSRPPNAEAYLMMVDCHDAVLRAAADSPDHAALESLKRHNAAVAAAVHAAWDAAGLPTERTYLRQEIRRARQARPGEADAGVSPPDA